MKKSVTKMVRNVCGCCLVLMGAGCRKASAPSEVTPPPLVTTAHPMKDAVIDRVSVVQGTFRARNAAVISARIPGAIDSLSVAEGAAVKKGGTLFQTDRVNCENALRAAKDDLAIARARLDEAVAARTKAVLDDGRLSRLATLGAVTKDAAEKASFQRRRAEAAEASARALVTKAGTGVSVAEKNLSDSLVCAPFDGVITRKLKEAGDFAGAGTPVFLLEDPSAYEVSFSLNADCYSAVTDGVTRVRLRSPVSLAGHLFPVTYKAPTVHPVTRTFEIRAAVPKGPDCASGMLVDGEVVLGSSRMTAVPSSALTFRDGRWSVFAVRAGKTVALPVTRGVEWKGRVGLTDTPDGFTSEEIVTEGVLLLNPDDTVRLRKDEAGKVSASTQK